MKATDLAGQTALQVWGLLFVLALMFGGLVAYLVTFSRAAYLGARFRDACGGYASAAKILYNLEEDNRVRLAGALSAHAFGMDKGPKS